MKAFAVSTFEEHVVTKSLVLITHFQQQEEKSKSRKIEEIHLWAKTPILILSIIHRFLTFCAYVTPILFHSNGKQMYLNNEKTEMIQVLH